MYGLPKNVRVVPVIQVCILVFLPYALFMFLYVCSYLLIKSVRAGSQVFALLVLFLCVILHTMWPGNSLHLLCILVCCACLPSV